MRQAKVRTFGILNLLVVTRAVDLSTLNVEDSSSRRFELMKSSVVNFICQIEIVVLIRRMFLYFFF